MIHEIGPNGIPYLRFESIPFERVAHGVMTRHGGVSPAPWESLNFSITVGDEYENVRQNSVLAHDALELDVSRQIDRYIAHTNRVWHVDERHLGVEAPYSDAIVTRTANLSLVMTFADCQPLIAYDPVQHILGVAHAGWRGTLAGVALSLVRAMQAEGSQASDLRAGLGPAIGNCCYEVGPDVLDHASSWPDSEAWFLPGKGDRLLLDMNAANESIFRRAGVIHVEKSEQCTACNTDTFFSYRGERPITGRFALIASLRP